MKKVVFESSASGTNALNLPPGAVNVGSSVDLPNNVLSQLKQLSPNLSSARIIKLPPGVRLVNATVGSLSLPRKANFVAPGDLPLGSNLRGLIKDVQPSVIAKQPRVIYIKSNKKTKEEKCQNAESPSLESNGPAGQSAPTNQPCDVSGTPSVPNVTAPCPNLKPKPKPWSREPRPLWKSKEPVVLYSGCKPENLLPKKKKLPPESLPCPKQLEDLLPKTCKYHISSFEELKSPESFKTEVRANITNKEDALKWLQDFENLSGTDFRITKTFKENSFRLIFKKCFKCHRNTQWKEPRKRESKRHVACPAKLSITIKNVDMKQSADLLLNEFPCVLNIYHNHCHPLNTPDALRFRRPLPELRQKFADMFRAKITPSAALRVHIADLKREYGDKYLEIVHDGAKCPPLPWCYRLYYETLGKKVKDGKRKSSRKSYHKKKTTVSSGKAPIQSFGKDTADNSSGIGNLDGESAGDEMQQSVNSLYRYEFMSSKDTEVNPLTHADQPLNTSEQHERLLNGTEMLVGSIKDSRNLPIDNCESGSDFTSNHDIGNDDCVNDLGNGFDVENQSETQCCGAAESTGDQPAAGVLGDKIVSSSHAEEIKQKLLEVFNDIVCRLESQPAKYLPVVKKFISDYENTREIGSGSHSATELPEFNSNLEEVMTLLPVANKRQVTVLDSPEEVLDLPPSLLDQHTLRGSKRRKVIVVRTDRSKLHEILKDTKGNLSKNDLANIISSVYEQHEEMEPA